MAKDFFVSYPIGKHRNTYKVKWNFFHVPQKGEFFPFHLFLEKDEKKVLLGHIILFGVEDKIIQNFGLEKMKYILTSALEKKGDDLSREEIIDIINKNLSASVFDYVAEEVLHYYISQRRELLISRFVESETVVTIE